MQQLMLPIIPQGTTIINGQVSVDNRNDEWFYFLGGIPIYSHQADNKRLFRLHTSQLINTGSCRSIDIITTFGVSKSSVGRSRYPPMSTYLSPVKINIRRQKWPYIAKNLKYNL